jgi:hypothetical protein
MELQMFVEAGGEMLTGDDAAMAADVKTLYDNQYGPMFDAAVASCSPAAPAPAPEEPAPAEPAPAEPAPAEPAPAEPAPAEPAPTPPG